MNCKNCNETLEVNDHFCDNCGAKVIKNRITFRFLMIEMFAVLGLESIYFYTLKKMLFAPQEVLNEYISGVRKKYINPFAFLAVGGALSLITFSFFSEEFKAMQSAANSNNVKEMKLLAEKDLSNIKNITPEEFEALKQKQKTAQKIMKLQDKYFNFFIRNFNLMAFLFLPVYALMSKLTYRKPHNFGEHIVMNAYLQGFTMYISLVAFLISIVTHSSIYVLSMLLYIVYYLYALGKLYQLSLGKSIKKLFKFILVFFVVVLGLTIIISILFLLFFFILKWLNPQLLKNMFS